MNGMLIVFFILLWFSAYITSIDKYNGKVEGVVNAIVWLFFIAYVLLKVLFGG